VGLEPSTIFVTLVNFIKNEITTVFVACAIEKKLIPAAIVGSKAWFLSRKHSAVLNRIRSHDRHSENGANRRWFAHEFSPEISPEIFLNSVVHLHLRK